MNNLQTDYLKKTNGRQYWDLLDFYIKKYNINTNSLPLVIEKKSGRFTNYELNTEVISLFKPYVFIILQEEKVLKRIFDTFVDSFGELYLFEMLDTDIILKYKKYFKKHSDKILTDISLKKETIPKINLIFPDKWICVIRNRKLTYEEINILNNFNILKEHNLWGALSYNQFLSIDSLTKFINEIDIKSFVRLNLYSKISNEELLNKNIISSRYLKNFATLSIIAEKIILNDLFKDLRKELTRQISSIQKYIFLIKEEDIAYAKMFLSLFARTYPIISDDINNFKYSNGEKALDPNFLIYNPLFVQNVTEEELKEHSNFFKFKNLLYICNKKWGYNEKQVKNIFFKDHKKMAKINLLDLSD